MREALLRWRQFSARLGSQIWRPALAVAALLCVAAGFLQAASADRASTLAVYLAGLLAGIGVLAGGLSFRVEVVDHDDVNKLEGASHD